MKFHAIRFIYMVSAACTECYAKLAYKVPNKIKTKIVLEFLRSRKKRTHLHIYTSVTFLKAELFESYPEQFWFLSLSTLSMPTSYTSLFAICGAVYSKYNTHIKLFLSTSLPHFTPPSLKSKNDEN